VSTAPVESSVLADSAALSPTTIVAFPGVTTTEATGAGAGALTVICAVPLCPSLVAVIVARPAATAVTVPVGETLAIPGADDAHTTGRPVSTLPAESRATALSDAVPPTVRLVVAGVTATDATGTAVTVIVALPLCPSLVAVMLAFPGEIAVTIPVGDTVATAGDDEVQLTARPVRMLPLASRATAASDVSAPTTSDAVAGLTATDAIGTGVTVIVALPTRPSLVAVMVVVPGATAVTSPVPETVATAGAPETQLTERPVRMLPFTSRATTASVVAAPTMRDALAGETVTVATGTSGAGFTVIAAVAVFPSTAAVIVADPGATPVTTPFAATVAIAGALESQVTPRPVRRCCDASNAEAVSVTEPPGVSVAEPGVMVTVATGTGGGALTITVAVPLFPSLAAVMLTVPGAIAVTAPVDETVAMAEELVSQVTTRPVSTLPAASRTVAVRGTPPPTVRFALAGLTVTEATAAGGGGGGAFTVICAVAVFPSLAAVIRAVPAATPLTFPAPSTVAT